MSSFVSEIHIRQVLQAVDVVDVIGNYVALSPKGKEMMGLCPFHDDRRPSLTVSPVKQIFKCFACGAGGDSIKFLMLREHLSFPEALRLLAERAGVELPREPREARGGADRGELEKVNRWAAQFFRGRYNHESEGQVARQYVQERGISEKTAEQFGMGWGPDSWDSLKNAARQAGIDAASLAAVGLVAASESQPDHYYDRFRGRLIFPVVDALGRVIGFGGRTLTGDSAKYLNSPQSDLFDKSRALYGLNAAKDQIIKQRTVVVVEGYTDCIMAHQCGVANVVATLGTALTEEHGRALSRYAERIVLVFDSDAAGEKAADRAIEIFFGLGVEVALATLPEGMDPCDFLLAGGKEKFDELIAGAVGALEYIWRSTLNRLEQADTIAGRRQATEEFMLLVAKASSKGTVGSVAEGFMLNQVAKLIGQPTEVVHNRVRQMRRRLRAGQDRNKQQVQTTRLTITDSYGKSQREVLEVLLNRLDLLGQVKETIAQASDFFDELLRAIAERVWEYSEQGGTGPLGELLGRCESTELCSMMTELADRGAERGNFEKTLEGALEHIRHVQAENSRREVRQLVSTAAEKYGQDAEAAMLAEIHSKWQPDMRRPGAR